MYLLDTNVLSELRKIRLGKADAHVAAWADSVDANDLYLSAITLQELEIGVLLAERRDPSQGAVFRAWLDAHVLPAFNGRLLAVDIAVAQRGDRLQDRKSVVLGKRVYVRGRSGGSRLNQKKKKK